MRSLIFSIVILLISLQLAAQEISLQKVEPPFWWTGFKNPELQLMIYGKNISAATISIDLPGITIKKIHKVKNPNYIFVDLMISPGAKAGIATLLFKAKDKIIAKYLYEFKTRKKGSAKRKSFTTADVIYLIVPDRFANGDPSNDNQPGMLETVNRPFTDGRHGGDLKGITDHLGYIHDLGATAIWCTPLLENNMAKYSYHGYSATDYYKVDSRFGTNEDYLRLSDSLHKKGMKLIQDMVWNHCGSEHWWIKDLPSPDWLNQWPEFTRSNYRAGTSTDPYASAFDSIQFVKGWFDKTMPDLNQHNPFLADYLIQNSIWWIEYAGLDGIRQDTHPYPFKDMMAEWGKRVLDEYPDFNIVGECWVTYPGSVAYWQKDASNKDRYNSYLPTVMDFPMYDALRMGFSEEDGWNTGIVRLYEILSQDFMYKDPSHIMLFAENHDVNRYLDTQKDDVRKLKMAMAFILTTRGIPQLFYGSEILLSTGADKGDGNKRKDFPGGWQEDGQNAFDASGRTEVQEDMYLYLSRLLNWRKNKEVIHTGKLKHFIPKDGIYVYFRYNEKETIMIAFNNNEKEAKTIETSRFNEFLGKYKSGHELISGQSISDLSAITVPAKSAVIIELEK